MFIKTYINQICQIRINLHNLYREKFSKFSNSCENPKPWIGTWSNRTQVEVALEIAPDQTVPDKWDLWSDRPRPKWPLIRRVCARRSSCARSALKAASDQTSSRPKWPLIRQVPDHCPDEFQTIVQTRVRSKYSPRLKCGRNHLWSDKSALEVASV